MQLFQDPELKINPDGTLDKKYLRNGRLVRLINKFAKPITETSSKVQEPKIYDKAISDSIHGN